MANEPANVMGGGCLGAVMGAVLGVVIGGSIVPAFQENTDEVRGRNPEEMVLYLYADGVGRVLEILMGAGLGGMIGGIGGSILGAGLAAKASSSRREAPDSVEPLHHPRLGTLPWNPLEKLWVAEVNRSCVRDGEIGVVWASDLDRAAGFLDWLAGNWDSFRAAAAYQAFNHDLIRDDDLEESALAAKLTIQSVTVRPDVVEVWFDTGGATTNRLLLAKLDRNHKIVGMEL